MIAVVVVVSTVHLSVINLDMNARKKEFCETQKKGNFSINRIEYIN